MDEENIEKASGAKILLYVAIAAVVLTVLVVGVAASKKKEAVQPAQAASPTSADGYSGFVTPTMAQGQTTIPTFTTTPLQTEPYTVQNSMPAVSPSEAMRKTYLVTTGTVRKYTPPTKTTTKVRTTKNPSGNTTTTTTKRVDAWRLAYKNYLSNHYSQLINENPNTDVYFAYIDANNIPEMIITRGSGSSSGAQIISYYDGALRDFGEYGFYGSIFYVEKGGVLITADDDEYSLNETAYSFNNGRIECIWTGVVDSSGHCYSNNVSVSVSDFLDQRGSYFNVDDVIPNGKICYSLSQDLVNNFEDITVF